MESKRHVSLSEYLKAARIMKGLTQDELAKKLGYSCAQFVSNWERGQCLPPIGKMKAVSKVLGLDHNDFVDLVMVEKRKEIMRAAV